MDDAVTWFLVRLQAELPARLHCRDLSEMGSPDWSRVFEAWLTDGDGRWQTTIRDDQEVCEHPTLMRPGYIEPDCPTCDGDGLRVRTRSTYRHPMKRAIHQLGTMPVPKGRPKLDAVLWALAAQDGNVDAAIASLRLESAFMWQERKARRWIAHALWKLRCEYREDVPARVLRKSESQSIAEAA